VKLQKKKRAALPHLKEILVYILQASNLSPFLNSRGSTEISLKVNKNRMQKKVMLY